jgi:hypothetical protein
MGDERGDAWRDGFTTVEDQLDQVRADRQLFHDLGTIAAEERDTLKTRLEQVESALQLIAEDHHRPCEWCEGVLPDFWCPTAQAARAALGDTPPREPPDNRLRDAPPYDNGIVGFRPAVEPPQPETPKP